jgi:uncharacterized protein
MSIFTPVTGFLGGSLIGLAADALLLVNGDILGASGIVSSVVLNPLQSLREPKQHWKIVFLSTFLTTASVLLGPHPSEASIASSGRALSTLGLSLAGLLVGFGTNLGNGCTSGHGICGLARLSKRSMAAVMTFMATGIATSTLLETYSDGFLYATVTRAASGRDGSNTYHTSLGLYLGAALALVSVLAPMLFHKKNATKWAKVPAAAVSGGLFAAGLRISQMVVQSKVLGFLTVAGRNAGHWDPTLVTVMGGGLMLSALGYQHTDTTQLQGKYVVPRKNALKRPVCGDEATTYDSCLPSSQVVDWQLILGSAMFGVGWGLAGYCPGPALYLAGAGDMNILRYWWPTFVVGSYVASKIKQQGDGGRQCSPATLKKST